MAAEAKQFTVCVLLYGDYPELAQRLFSSLIPLVELVEFRVGLNVVSEATRAIVERFAGRPRNSGHVLDDNSTQHKYPRMRQMFYGPHPVTTPYVIWLDDDSWLDLTQLNPLVCLARWAAALRDAALLGSPYSIDVAGNQRQWIEDQPWYTGKPIPDKLGFATGGGWIADFDVLRNLDYPWPVLDHNGGDVMLGQAIYQQGRKITGIHRLLDRRVFRINADSGGNESRAARRGFTSRPIGYNYTRTGTAPVAASIKPISVPVAAPPRPRFLMDLEL